VNDARRFYLLALLATLLAYGVVMLGAYVRLSDAGLGCPDWPGCYGHITVPVAEPHVAAANQAYPDRPVVAHKAWKEMVHRYFVGALSLCILALALMGWRRRKDDGRAVVLPLVLLALLVFQAALGMWTVTLKLMPPVVTAHLFGGLATLSLLLLVVMRQGGHLAGLVTRHAGLLRGLALAALLVLALQIFLGAWTSSNYAALACPDFPTCQGRWWPQTDFAEAFRLWRGLGVNYEYGVLENAPRLTIHLAHRLGAVLTVLTMLATALYLMLAEHAAGLRRLGVALLAAVLLQASLGIGIVLLHLPLPLAVAHNGGAALLLLVLVAINHAAWQAQGGRR
jgi:cytochrome c oxidase assembly protein subunit 15